MNYNNGFIDFDQAWMKNFAMPSSGLSNFDLNSSYNTSNGTNSNGFNIGFNIPTLRALTGGMEGLAGLANAYNAYKSLQLAKDQFKFQKGLANRNLANQAKIINNTYDNAAQVAAGLIGGKDSSGNYGMTNQAIVNQYTDRAKQQYVNGSPI